MSGHWLFSLACTLLCSVSLATENPPKAKGDEDNARDAAVLEAMLVDLLTHPDSPLEREKENDKRVFFSSKPLAFPIRAADVLRASDSKQWEKLSKEQLANTREAAEHLVRRVENKDLFKAFAPKDKRITMYSPEQAELDQQSPHFKRPQVFRAYSPGYSQDRQVAVVHLTFGWSGNFHGAQGTIVLARQKDEWIVLVRDFVFFL